MYNTLLELYLHDFVHEADDAVSYFVSRALTYLIVSYTRHVRKTWQFFSKYADHNIAKYAAKICGNSPRLHIHVNLTFLRDGIAQLLFSTFTAKLESTCRPNWKDLLIQMQQIQCCQQQLLSATNRLHPKNYYREYLMLPKYAEKYATCTLG